MKTHLRSSFSLDDRNMFISLTLLALILLLVFWLFFPSAIATLRIPAPQPVAMVDPAPLLVQPLPRAQVATRSQVPELPPMLIPTPVPVPTPAGGGILRKIAFTSNRADGRYYQIYMMDADGNNVERLMESQAFDRDPHFSHDGKRLAFTSNRSGIYQIYCLNLETRAVRCLTQGAADKTNPFFSPDDTQLLYTLHRNGSSELGLMSADGREVRQLTDRFGNSHGYGFSPDGRRVSFESTMNNRDEIFVLDLATRESTLLIDTDELTYRGDPVFSPLGHKLVFSSNVLERGIRQLYIYDLDWKKYYRITNDELDKDDPIFSPDGSKIAYVARWENAWNIFVMNADGQHARNLTRSYYDNVVPSWR